MKAREFKDAVFNQFARLAQAMCSPKRLEIIDILIQGERDVETIARETNLTVANTSRHLQVLKNAHLVDFRKDGVRNFYRVSDIAVYNCWKNLQSLAENLLPEVRDTVQRFYIDRASMETISKDPEFVNELLKNNFKASFLPGKTVMEEKIPVKMSLIKGILQSLGTAK